MSLIIISISLFFLLIFIDFAVAQLSLLAYLYKKLSYCCDSRSYCMQEYDWLKQPLRDIYFTLFIVIAASRPANKNVNTGALVRAK